MSAILEAKHINKYFKKPVLFHVLKDINFTVKKGEFASIMGKSGCGKSTLLYILSTMDTDYEGELYLNNKLISGEIGDHLSYIRNKHIGFVFQFHYLLSEFSVLENIMLPAKKLGEKSFQEIEHDAILKLKMLNIEHLLHKKASQISGGEKQRVAIARALINNPSIIMGDEPTGNLDSHNSDNVFNILNNMALNDKSACVRATAIESTAQRCKKNPIYSPKIVEQSQITAFDKSTNVRRATAFAISVINDKATIPLLINLLKDPNGDVRNWAAFAININKYDNSDIRDCFVEMLQDKNEEVRIEAIIGLSYRKDKRVLSVLCDELKKNTVYDDIIEAAGELGDKTLLPVLDTMLYKFDDNEIITSAIDKLKRS